MEPYSNNKALLSENVGTLALTYFMETHCVWRELILKILFCWISEFTHFRHNIDCPRGYYILINLQFADTSYVTIHSGYFPKHRFMLDLQIDSLACFYNVATKI